jgi:hypothetical protein
MKNRFMFPPIQIISCQHSALSSLSFCLRYVANTEAGEHGHVVRSSRPPDRTSLSFKLEQTASLHRGKDTPYSGATKGTMPSCLLVFSNFFKKFRQLCRDQSHERKVFDGNSNSWKVKMTAYVRWRVAIHSKLQVLTPPRLWHEDLRILL